LQAAQADLYPALVAGDEGAVRQILFDLFLAGLPLSRVFDEVVAPTFHQIGRAWECGEAEIYQERRAVDVTLRVFYELRQAIGPTPESAPLAVGGAPPPDPYSLATTMVELVLRQNGWNAQSLGSRLPFPTLRAAVRKMRPHLMWLSVSHLDDEAAFLEQYRAFFEEVRNETMVVVGGQALHEQLRRQMQFAAHCDNLQQFEHFAAALRRLLDSEAHESAANKQRSL
jgi:methanogenic corrinoid protein MtbC1